MKKVAVLGTGNMAQAILKGLAKNGRLGQDQWFLFNPTQAKAQQLAKELDSQNVTVVDLVAHIPEVDILILAFKPQQLKTVVAQLTQEWKGLKASGLSIVSLLAAVPLPTLKGQFPTCSHFARCMPNTPLQVGKGVTAWFFESAPSLQTWCLNHFQALGRNVVLKEESMLEAITPISGSGPAYFFEIGAHLAEFLTQHGMEEKLAMEVTADTLEGAALLMKQAIDQGISFTTLRDQVTSKKGVTEAALAELGAYNQEGRALWMRAMGRALSRIQEITRAM